MMLDMVEKRTYTERVAAGKDPQNYRKGTRKLVTLPDELWDLLDEKAGKRKVNAYVQRVLAES